MASCAVASMTTNSKSKADSYVESLAQTCIYDDGYVCAEKTDPFFYTRKSQQSLLPAVYLAVWPKAYEKFLSLPELSDAQKGLHHYKIGFAEEGEDYVVLFSALLMPRIEGGKAKGASRVTYGKATKIWVNKKTLEITKQLYLK